jgi:hypothetical protein
MSTTLSAEMTAGPDPVPVKLFTGYDTVARGMMSSSAITGDHEKSDARSTVRVEVCESLSELADALEIDASLSVSYLKAVSVTAKMEFAKKLNVTAKSVTIVVYAVHGIGTWSAKNVRLQDGVKTPTNDDSAADFAQSYGDSFISSVTLGGEFFAVYIFNTETREEQQSLAASLKGEGIGGGVETEAEVQVKLSKFLKTTKTSWTLKQEITGIANPAFPAQDKLIDFALKFSTLQLTSPATTNIKVQGHESVPNFGRKFIKVVKNRRYFLNAEDGLLHSLAQLTIVRNQVAWLKRIYDRYNYQGDSGLLAFERELLADIKAINSQVADWEMDAAGDFAAPKLPTLAQGEPVLQFDEPQARAWGGTGPGPWDVMSVGNAIRNRVRIQSIQIATGKFDGKDLLGRLELEYVSDRRNWTERHGEDVKMLQPKLNLEEGQFPVRFEVRYGLYVDWLRIHLGDGRTTEAGGPGGGSDDWTVPKDHFVVGFGGRSGGIIDQLQILYARLKPAKMVKTR